MFRTFSRRSVAALAALSLSAVLSIRVAAQTSPAAAADVTAGDPQAEVITFRAPGATPEIKLRPRPKPRRRPKPNSRTSWNSSRLNCTTKPT